MDAPEPVTPLALQAPVEVPPCTCVAAGPQPDPVAAGPQPDPRPEPLRYRPSWRPSSWLRRPPRRRDGHPPPTRSATSGYRATRPRPPVTTRTPIRLGCGRTYGALVSGTPPWTTPRRPTA